FSVESHLNVEQTQTKPASRAHAVGAVPFLVPGWLRFLGACRFYAGRNQGTRGPGPSADVCGSRTHYRSDRLSRSRGTSAEVQLGLQAQADGNSAVEEPA